MRSRWRIAVNPPAADDVDSRPEAPGQAARQARWSVLVWVVLIGMLLAACGQGSSSAGDATHKTRTQPTSGPPGSAPTQRTYWSSDPTDITRVEAVHRPATLLLRVTVADTAGLRPCRNGTDRDWFIFHVDTDGDPRHEREISLRWRCGPAQVVDYIDDIVDGVPHCRVPARLDADTSSVTLVVPRRCLGSPPRLRVPGSEMSDHDPPQSTRRDTVDATAWTPFADVGATSSVDDPVGDANRHTRVDLVEPQRSPQ